MNIDLPNKGFTYENKDGGIDAWTDEKRVLKMKSHVSFKKLMKAIAYALKGRKVCYYCGKEMKKTEITIDHAIPQEIGGPTIPNNLYPACSKCNSEKSNLLAQQYFKLRILKSEKERKKYREKCLKENEKLKYISHSKILGNMVTYMSVSDVKLVKGQAKDKDYHYTKYAETEKFYETYNRLKKPIIVDKNLKLLGGFISLMYCKEHGIDIIPVIVIENIEIIE